MQRNFRRIELLGVIQLGIIYQSATLKAETPVSLSVWELPIWFVIGILWGVILTLVLLNVGVITK